MRTIFQTFKLSNHWMSNCIFRNLLHKSYLGLLQRHGTADAYMNSAGKKQKTIMNRTDNNSKLVQVDDANFDTEVLQSKQPVLVAFLASWSHPCEVLAPVLDEIAPESSGKLKVVKVNADASVDLSLWYGIQSIPTLLYFVAGSVRARVVGTATKEAILSKLQPVSQSLSFTPDSTNAKRGNEH